MGLTPVAGFSTLSPLASFTPAPVTLTPSPTLTLTPTGTLSPTPTATTLPVEDVILNFRVDDFGAVQKYDNYVPNTGWASGTGFVNIYGLPYSGATTAYYTWIEISLLENFGYVMDVDYFGYRVVANGFSGFYVDFANYPQSSGSSWDYTAGLPTGVYDFAANTVGVSASYTSVDRIGLNVQGTVSTAAIVELRLRGRKYYINGTPTPTPTATVTGVPTATATLSPTPTYPMVFLPSVDCSTPVYADNDTPAVDMEVDFEGRTCYRIFPEIDIDPINIPIINISTPDVATPAIDLCFVFYSPALTILGVPIDIGMLVSVGLALFLMRWALFN